MVGFGGIRHAGGCCDVLSSFPIPLTSWIGWLSCFLFCLPWDGERITESNATHYPAISGVGDTESSLSCYTIGLAGRLTPLATHKYTTLARLQVDVYDDECTGHC